MCVCVYVWDQFSVSGLAWKKGCLFWSRSLESKSSACERAHGNTHAHCVQPVLHTSLSLAKCFCFLFWNISRYSIFHRPFCRKLTCPIKPCLQPDSLSPKQTRSSSAVCRLPPIRPSLSSLCRLHYSPLIVKSFCSISTHPFYKHTLFIFLFFLYSLQILLHNVLFGSAAFLKTSQSFDLWSFEIHFFTKLYLIELI